MPDDHLDLEAASAAVDGEGTEAERAHLARCSTCRAEVQRLDRVRSAVGGFARPVPPAVREAAISAALEVFDESERRRAPAPTGASSDVVVLRTRQRSRPRVDAGPWLGVAAAVLLLALAVPLLSVLGGGGGDDADQATSMEDAAGGAADGAAGDEESSALPAPAGGTVDVGDLGELDAGSDLGAVVTRALPGDADGAADATAAEPGAPVAEDETIAPPEDLTTTSPAPAAPGTEAGDGAAPPFPTDCADPVRAERPEAGALLLTGTATVEGAPAFVLGFETASDVGATVLTVIVTAPGCEIVSAQSHVTG